MSTSGGLAQKSNSAGAQPDVSVIVVNWNLKDILRECLESVRRQGAGLSLELIVVDNASSDGSADMIAAEFPEALLIRNAENRGFSSANNQGMEAAGGRYLFLLNSDAILHEDALVLMVEFMDANSEAGVCGPRVINQDGTPQLRSKGYFPSIPRALAHFFLPSRIRHGRLLSLGFYEPGDSTGARPVDWLSGCALMVRSEAVDQVGALDADVFMYCEDVDWCFRMKQAGWNVYYVPAAAVTHFGGQSMKLQTGRTVGAHAAGLVAFYAKYHGAARTGVFRAAVWLGYGVKAVGWLLAALAGRGSGFDKLRRMFPRARSGSSE